MDWLQENWLTLLNIAAGLIAAASVALKLLAPKTENKTDDKIAGWLDKLVGLLSKLSLNTNVKK